nr:hypothetical protein [uncultured Prevotella sp.]
MTSQIPALELNTLPSPLLGSGILQQLMKLRIPFTQVVFPLPVMPLRTSQQCSFPVVNHEATFFMLSIWDGSATKDFSLFFTSWAK